jgi:hypothetical protein
MRQLNTDDRKTSTITRKETDTMDARIIQVGWDDRRDTGFVEVWLSGVDRNALGTIRLAFASFTEASREQARLADLPVDTLLLRRYGRKCFRRHHSSHIEMQNQRG